MMSEEDRCIEIIEERDMLADENRKFAEFLSSLGYNLDSIGEIARVGTKFNEHISSGGYYITLNIANNPNRGSWDFPDGTEGGELIFENRTLIDCDGCYVLSKTILDKLTELGYDCEDFLRGYDDKDYPNETE